MRIFVLLGALVLPCLPLNADLIYVATSNYYVNGTYAFGTYDTLANTFTSLGTGSTQLCGLGFDGGALYGVDCQYNPDLYTVNTNDGAVSLVGAFGVSGYGTLSSLRGGGTLYAIDQSDLLLTIDPLTGAAEPVGPLGFTPGAAWDANYGPDGNLYASSDGSLYQINTATGAGSVIGPFGGGLQLQSIVSADGHLYGFDGGAMYSVNLTSGAATFIQTAPFQFEAETQIPGSASPEPGSLLLCLGGVVLFVRRFAESADRGDRR